MSLRTVAVSGHQNVISYNDAADMVLADCAVSGHQNVISYNGRLHRRGSVLLCLDIKT